MKIINLSRVGIPKKTFFKDFFLPKFASKVAPRIAPKVAPNVSQKSSKSLYLWFPPNQYIRQYPLKFLLNSQAQFLLLILLLLYHFIFLLLFVLSYCYICHIHVIFIPNYHFKFPMVASKVSPKSYNKSLFIIPP